MARDSGPADVEPLGEGASGQLIVSDELEDAAANRIGDGCSCVH
jgi:hypothetical protein